MNTLVRIAKAVCTYVGLLQEYKQQLNENRPQKEEIESIQKSFIDDLCAFKKECPELAQYKISNEKGVTSNGIKSAIKTIAKNASSRYSVPFCPLHTIIDDVIQVTENVEESSHIVTPQYEGMTNMVFSYAKENYELAYNNLCNLILTRIISIPIGKLQFNIVDLTLSLHYDSLISLFPKEIDGGIAVREEKEFEKLLDIQIKRVEQYKKNGKDFEQDNEERKSIAKPYQVIILTDSLDVYQKFGVKLRTLLEQGIKAGISFLIMDPIKKEQKSSTESRLGIFKDVYRIDIKPNEIQSGLVYPSLIWNNQLFKEACLTYINDSSLKVKDDKVEEISTLTDQDYCLAEGEFDVPVGNNFTFKLNTIDHPHAFVIGQSGSGKSVFLHDIISSMILKYAPEELQLNLLDFKIGGVEFNRYKGVKHVKAMLVDNSDQQITLEILRGLKEQMEKRGKQLRNAGVSNIMEYNEGKKTDRMPHILVVADECHELFRVGDDIPRAVSTEISEIVTKIAKEGRSQGVHLILATQTLSGTEISNEILNNISDHYLLKCSQMDSERMVPGSSDITSSLATGQIYYHHVDEQIQFQAFYTNKEDAQKSVKSAIKKAKEHQSNGEFYFSGSQLFTFSQDALAANKKLKKYPVVFAGKSIDLKQKDVSITLKDDYSENILVFGLNDEEQVTRTTMNLMTSVIMTSKKGGLELPITVINCLTNEDSPYETMLDDLEDANLCTIINSKKRGTFLKKLAEDIQAEKAEPQILFILDQDKFRELKFDKELDSKTEPVANDDFASMLGGFSSDNGAAIKTYRKALEVILDRGPEVGVHTIIQIEKPINLLFEDLTAKEVFQKFKHLIMLKSDEMAASRLNLRDNIRLENLSKDAERLRAFYYAEESDEYTLFTPYTIEEGTNIVEQIESI